MYNQVKDTPSQVTDSYPLPAPVLSPTPPQSMTLVFPITSRWQRMHMVVCSAQLAQWVKWEQSKTISR